jgi:hypothetical protein
MLNRIGAWSCLPYKEFIRRCEHGPTTGAQDTSQMSRDGRQPDDFVKQWFFEAVVPQRESPASVVHIVGGSDGALEDEWEIRVKVKNAGTGRMPVEIAATRGERFPDEKDGKKEAAKKQPGTASEGAIASDDVVQAAESSSKPSTKTDEAAGNKSYREARTMITIGAGETQDVVPASSLRRRRLRRAAQPESGSLVTFKFDGSETAGDATHRSGSQRRTGSASR